MRIGTEDKRKVYLLAFLCAIIVAIATLEFHGSSTSQSAAPTHAAPRSAASAQRSTESIHGQSDASFDLKLHIGQLARVEQVVYSSTDRDIFFPKSEAPRIEVPRAPPRPDPAAANPPVPLPEQPKPPAMDMKYLGYAQGSDKSFNAVLLRGNDSLMARTGEIVFHRYRIGLIQPTSVQVTDLSFNNTETIHLAEK